MELLVRVPRRHVRLPPIATLAPDPIARPATRGRRAEPVRPSPRREGSRRSPLGRPSLRRSGRHHREPEALPPVPLPRRGPGAAVPSQVPTPIAPAGRHLSPIAPAGRRPSSPFVTGPGRRTPLAPRQHRMHRGSLPPDRPAASRRRSCVRPRAPPRAGPSVPIGRAARDPAVSTCAPTCL